MRIATSCVTCDLERDSLERGEVVYAELEDDKILIATCSKGHEIRYVLQQAQFELLMEMGGMALLDGYYREAVSSFAAALERFFEFYILVVGEGRQVSGTEVGKAWKLMANQSERQIGAFVILHLLEMGTPPLLDEKMAKFRNDVIHKGVFPSKSSAYSYGKWAFEFIVSTGFQLRAKHEEAAFEVLKRKMGPSWAKAREKGGSVGLQYTPMFLSWTDSSWASATFDRSMKNLEERRHHTWAPPATPFDK